MTKDGMERAIESCLDGNLRAKMESERDRRMTLTDYEMDTVQRALREFIGAHGNREDASEVELMDAAAAQRALRKLGG